MKDLDATSLRFTVYTRDDEGSIVELLNTGMIGIRRFLNVDGPREEGESARTEIILDYEDDVSSDSSSSTDSMFDCNEPSILC